MFLDSWYIKSQRLERVRCIRVFVCTLYSIGTLGVNQMCNVGSIRCIRHVGTAVQGKLNDNYIILVPSKNNI